MSGAVDSAVYDYFSLLLREPESHSSLGAGLEPEAESTLVLSEESADPNKGIAQELPSSLGGEPGQTSINVLADTLPGKGENSTYAYNPGARVADFGIKGTGNSAAPRQVAEPAEVAGKNLDSDLPKAQVSLAAESGVKPTLEKDPVDRAVLERLLATVEDLPEETLVKSKVISEIETLAKPPDTKIEVKAKNQLKAEGATKITTKIETVTETSTEHGTNSQVKVEEPVRRLADIVAEIKLEQQTVALPEQDTEQLDLQTQAGMSPPGEVTELSDVLDDDFQVLFFEIAGLTLAVPLVSLGGIIRLESLNHIIGRPDWYLGLQTYRGEQINVVDTCAWVMPEHIDKDSVESKNYQYVVQLAKSNWGLACESLLNATRIDKSQVNWRTRLGKRPWLAGVVKEQMCGILNVDALITMLDAGLGCQDPIG